MTALRQRMIEDLKIRNRSPRTISTYIACVANFARHFRNSPAVLGPEEIRQYQVYLVRERKVSWSYFNQVVSALRFLYRVTLGREWTISHIPYPRQPRKLPLILSPAEVQRFFATIKHLKYRAILMTAYAAGLRLSEVTHLQVADIDSQRMLIRVRQGKGQKDRYVMLSPTLLELLRVYWRSERPGIWLFPGRQPHLPIECSSVQRACRQAGREAGLSKPVTVRLLRHCFATHLLDASENYPMSEWIKLVEILIWPLITVIILILLYPHLRIILNVLTDRIRAGAKIETPWVTVDIVPTVLSAPSKGELVTQNHIALVHSSWRYPKKDEEYKKPMPFML